MSTLINKDALLDRNHQLNQIHAPVRTTRAFDHIPSLTPPDKYGTVKGFGKLVRNDSHDTDLPRRTADDDHFANLSFLEHFLRLFHYSRDRKLSFPVQIGEVFRTLARNSRVLCRKKLERTQWYTHA